MYHIIVKKKTLNFHFIENALNLYNFKNILKTSYRSFQFNLTELKSK